MNTAETRLVLQRSLAELAEVRATLLAEAGGGPGMPVASSELSSLSQHPADAASDLAESELDLAVLDVTDARIAEVHAALARLEAGTYGTCVDCGQPVSAARLEIRPEAGRCIDCQHKADRAA